MENCLNTTKTLYKDIQEYKNEIDNVIQNMIYNKERLVFAIVAEKSGITRFVIRKYPELRNYILNKMVHYKEIHVINEKIDRAVASLLKSNNSITFIAIVNKCKFNSDMIYRNQYIKDRIKNIIASNIQKSV